MKAANEQQKGFLNRLQSYEDELRTLYQSLFGDHKFERLLDMLRLKWSARPDSMLDLDEQRLKNPLWYQDSTMIGMMLYVDNFSGTFASMPARLDYLEELGVTYLHIMPVFSMMRGRLMCLLKFFLRRAN